MLQGVKTLELIGEPKGTLHKLHSNEGEVLDLSKKGDLKLTGKVEHYLNDLIVRVRVSWPVHTPGSAPLRLRSRASRACSRQTGLGK